MNADSMNKSVNETTSTTNNVVNGNNNQQNVDNSQNTNKTEYGSTTIGVNKTSQTLLIFINK